MSRPSLDRIEGQDARVFVGNVAPDTDPRLIEERFSSHGNVEGVSVFKGFAFVQFSEAGSASAAIEKENQTEFLGKRIDVKTAKRGPPKNNPPPEQPTSEAPPTEAKDGAAADPPMREATSEPQYPPNYRGRGRGRGGYDYDRGRGRGRGGYYPRGRGGYYGGGGYEDYGYNAPAPPPPQQRQDGDSNRKANDCEIVCVSKNQRQYAERIEGRLRVIGLKVDVLFPNPRVDLVKILDNISSRGVKFAVLVTPLNEDHQSVTLNVLQGQQQEHRNMPLEDAISMIAQQFEAGLDNAGSNKVGSGRPGMPTDVKNVFGFLMENRPLSVMEFDKLIKYLVKEREGMLKNEYGENIPANLITPPIGPPIDPSMKAKQDELQSKIMDILNKKKEAMKPPVSTSGHTPELSASLQKAIDSLIKTGPNLLNPAQQQQQQQQQQYHQPGPPPPGPPGPSMGGGYGGQQDYSYGYGGGY